MAWARVQNQFWVFIAINANNPKLYRFLALVLDLVLDPSNHPIKG